MKHTIIGKNIEITQALGNIVEENLHKLDRYFNEDTKVQVTLSVEKLSHIIEITIPFNGQVLRAEVSGKDMYAIIDDAISVIERQVIRFKNRLRAKSRGHNEISFTSDFMNDTESEEQENLQIAKTKRFAIKPMDSEEAVLQMELVGHNFFVYRDAKTDEVNVVYKRKNGTYGLIEPVID